MMVRLKVGTKYPVQPNRMICDYNEKGCFPLSLTNMPPLKTTRVRARSSPWITSELKKRMHDQHILNIKACKSNNPNDWTQFKKLRVDESKIRPAVYFNMKVSITQRDKYRYDWCVRPLQTNIIFPASFNNSLSVSLCPCKKTLLQVQTNLVEPWQVSDKHVPLLHEIVLKKKKLYSPSRKKSTSCTYHCVQKYFRPVKSI